MTYDMQHTWLCLTTQLLMTTVCDQCMNDSMQEGINTCEDEEVDGGGIVANRSVLEEASGAGKIERESSVMRLPKREGNGWALLEAGGAATKDAGAEEEASPKQLESGSAGGTQPYSSTWHVKAVTQVRVLAGE